MMDRDPKESKKQPTVVERTPLFDDRFNEDYIRHEVALELGCDESEVF